MVEFCFEDLTFFFDFRDYGKVIKEGNVSALKFLEKCLVFKMNPLHEEDTLMDVRERISLALNQSMLSVQVCHMIGRNKLEDLLADVIGQRSFHML